jgi:hypothetical protein
MTPRTSAPLALLLAGTGLIAAGCESTQEKSARIAAELGPVKQEKGLEIDKESRDVEVVSTTVLSDPNGAAVVVRLRNESDQDLTDVPIAIDVLDSKGKSIFKNDVPGIEPALTSMPLLRAGSEADWVHNQILAAGKPADVKVEVGNSSTTLDAEPPDIEVSGAELAKDPVSGIEATGSAVNNTDERQERLLLFCVARSGNEVVAAGRGAIDHLGPGRDLDYHVFFIGDPTGAELEVTSFPNQPETP